MKYEEFVVDVKRRLEEKLKGTDCKVEIHKVLKSNDCGKDGITLRRPGICSAPTLYLNDFYEWHQFGAGPETVADKILELCGQNRIQYPDQLLNLEDFSKAKDHITFRILNLAANREYLRDAPYMQFLDLAVVFYCTVLAGEDLHVLSCKITNALMEAWKTDPDTLYGLAMENTPRLLGIYLKEVTELFEEMLCRNNLPKDSFFRDFPDAKERMPLYVLSNLPRSSGAGCILAEGVLRELSEQLENDLFIVPSSIHEVLLLPADGNLSGSNVNQMIREINREVLRPQDILSDHYYYYSRKEDRILLQEPER